MFPLAILPLLFLAAKLASAQSHFTAKVKTSPSPTDATAELYTLTMQWAHESGLSVLPRGVVNAGSSDDKKSKVCDHDSSEKASDGKEYWQYRLYPQQVDEEITRITGVTIPSIDWTPCGHKNIVICHAESHYDFHLYYVSQKELDSYKCELPLKPYCPLANTESPTTETGYDNKMFRVINKGNIPKSYTKPGQAKKDFDYCVDETSGIQGSGIHYGDRSETLNEWAAPVTIIGSFDCQMTFFEPMFSWKWMIGRTNGQWPKFESGLIEYFDKSYRPLPDEWTVEVGKFVKSSDGSEDSFESDQGQMCRDLGNGIEPSNSNEYCGVQVVVKGVSCMSADGKTNYCGENSRPPKECGVMSSCNRVGQSIDAEKVRVEGVPKIVSDESGASSAAVGDKINKVGSSSEGSSIAPSAGVPSTGGGTVPSQTADSPASFSVSMGLSVEPSGSTANGAFSAAQIAQEMNSNIQVKQGLISSFTAAYNLEREAGSPAISTNQVTVSISSPIGGRVLLGRGLHSHTVTLKAEYEVKDAAVSASVFQSGMNKVKAAPDYFVTQANTAVSNGGLASAAGVEAATVEAVKEVDDSSSSSDDSGAPLPSSAARFGGMLQVWWSVMAFSLSTWLMG